MKNLSIFVAVMVSAMGSMTWACGGSGSISDDRIISIPFVQAVRAEVARTYGDSVEIESIVHSENNILDLNKKVIARFRCAANLIHIYMKPQTGDFYCMTAFQVNQDGSINFEGIKSGVECRRAGEDGVQWIPVPAKG